MSDDDQIRAMREWAAQLSSEELEDVLHGILGGVSATDAAPHTPEMPMLPDPPEEAQALTVRVDIDETRPPVWRRVVLRGDLLLDELHAVLQAAFGWQDYHLHKFWPGPAKRVWRGPSFLTEYDLAEGEEGVLESEVRLDQLLRSPGDRLFYTYDFGDDWTHTLRLESLGPLDPDSPTAVCTGGRMAGPLEDCGGPHGHNELVDAHRAGNGLADLDEDQRAWLPPDWDPNELDLDEVAHRLSLVGLSADELLERLRSSGEEGEGAGLPVALEPLLDLALPRVVAELDEWVARAQTEQDGELSEQDVAAIARPYRYLVELAGDDGIPLTAAGWMRPAYVERVYRDLGMEEGWIGKGNREDQTLPVAQLRALCQEVGLLRKHKGRLLRTRLAKDLSTDEEYVAALTGRLLHHRDTFVTAARALFALLTAATGRPAWEHSDVIARVMTDCGLRTGPLGVDPRHVSEWVRPVRATLRRATGERLLHDGPHPLGHRAVALARAALWPEAQGQG